MEVTILWFPYRLFSLDPHMTTIVQLLIYETTVLICNDNDDKRSEELDAQLVFLSEYLCLVALDEHLKRLLK